MRLIYCHFLGINVGTQQGADFSGGTVVGSEELKDVFERVFKSLVLVGGLFPL